MSVYMEEIAKQVPSDASVFCKRPMAKIRGIKRLQELSVPDPNFLYIGTDTETDMHAVLGMHRLNLLLYSERKLFADQVSGDSNVICINSWEKYNALIMDLLETFSRQSNLNEISNQMLKIVRDGSDIKKLLRYAYQLLNNPIMLVNVSFNYIDSVGTEAVNEENWKYAIDNKTFSLSYIKYVMSSIGGEETDDEIRIERPDDVMSLEQYSMKVLRNNVVLGYIKMLKCNREVSSFDLEVFRLLSKYLAFSDFEERGQAPNTDSLSETFLRSLLERTLTDKNEIQSRQALFNIKLYESLHIIVIQFDGAVSHKDQIYYTLRKFRSFFSGSIITWFENSFVMLYDTRETDCTHDRIWQERFSQLLNTLKCKANISTAFTSLRDIYNYYKQAKFCTELRSIFHDFGPILHYEDVFEYHMIVHLGKEAELTDMIHPAVSKLMELEEQGEAYLLQTLFTYNRNHCNISSTAKEMFLHYNTLKHRVSRIEELTGFTGENSRDCFLVALSEKILRVLEGQKETVTPESCTKPKKPSLLS